MQLTNICRDVHEDWDRERLYIPADMLAQAGAANLPAQLGRPLPAESRQPLAIAVRRLLIAANRYYASGQEGLPYLTWRCALAVRTASDVYARIGSHVASTGCDVFAGRAFVPTGEKVRVILRAVAASLPAIGNSTLVAGKPPRLPSNVVLRFPEDVLPV
jgi:phytoene synthase